MIKVKELAKWIERGIKELGDGEAFCFNLYEDTDEWTCELLNTNSFDKNDSDWVCDEKNIYSRNNPLSICKKKEVKDFQTVLDSFKKLLNESLLFSNEFKKLANAKTIAYGFVDGDLRYLN